jgi:hypothetical protein
MNHAKSDLGILKMTPSAKICQSSASALTLHCGQLVAIAKADQKSSDEEWQKSKFADYASFSKEFRNAARNDLALHQPRHTVEEWKNIFFKSK